MNRTRLVVLVTLALFLAACATTEGPSTTPTPGPAPAERVEDKLGLDPAITAGVLDNGLRYFVRQNNKPEQRAELRLVVHAGSVLEDEDQRGLAHFVEHMAFNGTENYEKQELVDYLEGIGMRFGPDLNAYTSFDETVYMLQVPTDDQELLMTGLDVLREWAGRVSFADEEIEKERGVILEEWRLGRGARARIRDKQFPVLLKGSRYAERLPIGDPEIIEKGSPDALRRFYRDWYRPDLMTVIAVGDVDVAMIEEKIRSLFGDLRNPDDARERTFFDIPSHDETLVSIETDPEASSSSIAIYAKHDAEGDPRSVKTYRKSIVRSLVGRMLNFRLYELSEQADPPFLYAFATRSSFTRTKEFAVQSVALREGELQRGLIAALTEVARAERHGFTSSELERVKKETLRSIERAYEERDKQESRSYASELVRHALVDEPAPGIEAELELYRRFLPTITLEEVNDVAKNLYGGESRVILYSSPEKEGLAVPEEQEILAMLDSVEMAEIEPYEDEALDASLLARQPEPGRVVETSERDDVGVTFWTLSNGVRVALKPTDFKNDQVLFAAFGPGGFSRADLEEPIPAVTAAMVVGAGGVGPFDQIALQKYMAGKVAAASAYISSYSEGLRGSASPADLELLFELIHARVTAPRRDEEAFASMQAWQREMIKNRLSSPSQVFSDEIEAALWDGHWIHTPWTEENIEAMDLERSMEVYRERFADVSDFTFIFVGNFDPDTLKPLVERYVASLPGGGRDDTWKDLGDRRSEGLVKVETRKGLEDKSSVRLLFHGDATWSRAERYAMRSLGEALRIRLREILREDMGGTYGVGAGGGISRIPEESFTFSVSFGCAPDKVEEMIAAVEAEIERVKLEGVPQEVVDKVREAQTRERELQLERNGFWLSALRFVLENEQDPADILTYSELFETLSSDMIRDAARRYLSGDNRLEAVLYPEEKPAS